MTKASLKGDHFEPRDAMDTSVVKSHPEAMGADIMSSPSPSESETEGEDEEMTDGERIEEQTVEECEEISPPTF
jgi:hypothetical protein